MIWKCPNGLLAACSASVAPLSIVWHPGVSPEIDGWFVAVPERDDVDTARVGRAVT